MSLKHFLKFFFFILNRLIVLELLPMTPLSGSWWEKASAPSCWRLLVSIPDALELAWTYLALLRNDEGRKKMGWVDQCVYDTWQEERVGAFYRSKSANIRDRCKWRRPFIYLLNCAQRGRWRNLVQFCTRLYFSSSRPVHWNL